MATENYLNRNGHAPVGAQYTYAARPRSRKYKSSQKEEGLSNGLIILVIAIVVGCFAVLWPKYFYPMFFGGEPGPNHNYDPEKLFMEGPHGREYMRNKLKDGGGHPGVHPGTGDQSNRRATPPIRPAADVRKSKCVILVISMVFYFLEWRSRGQTKDAKSWYSPWHASRSTSR